jgi:hypothetical protein
MEALMKHRGGLSKRERSLRSQLHKVITETDGFVHGSIIRMARVCGNPRCKCAVKGEKHVSFYLGQTRKRKTRMKYIPKVWEERIQRWVANYKTAADLLEQISEEGWSKLKGSQE